MITMSRWSLFTVGRSRKDPARSWFCLLLDRSHQRSIRKTSKNRIPEYMGMDQDVDGSWFSYQNIIKYPHSRNIQKSYPHFSDCRYTLNLIAWSSQVQFLHLGDAPNLPSQIRGASATELRLIVAPPCVDAASRSISLFRVFAPGLLATSRTQLPVAHHVRHPCPRPRA